MAKFLNTATDEIVETDDPEIDERGQPNESLFNEARSKGFEALMDVVDTKTGQTHPVKRSDPDLRAGLDSGRFVIPQLWEAKQQEREAKAESIGPGTAAAAGFAKGATLGGASAIGGLREMAKGGEYGAGRKAYEEIEESAWEKEPLAYGIGYTASILPGLAAKGITKAGQVALGAFTPMVEEATRVDEPITEERAKGIATKVGLGAGLGSIGALAQAKAPTAAQKMGEIAERRAVKAIGADVLKPQRRIERMPGGRQAFGRELLESGIVTGSKTVPKMQDKATQLATTSGEAVGKAMQQFDTQIGAPSISRQALLSEIEALPAELAKNPAKVSLAQRLESSFVSPLREWAKEGDAATLEEVWQIRSALDDLAYTPSGIDKPLNKELQRVRKLLESRLETTAKNAGITDQQINAYQKAKRTYQVAKEAAAVTKEKIDRMQSNRVFSLSDYLTGQGGMVSGAVGGLSGAAVGGGLSGTIAGAVMGAIGNKIARERGPQVAAATLDRLSKMMKENPDAFQATIAAFIKTGSINLGE